MGHNTLRIKVLFFGMILCLMTTAVHGGNSIEAAGDVVTFLLPAAAAGMTVALKDREGALQLGTSAVVTLGVTYGLKYTVNETRPNGDSYSFPSAHTSVSFASAEYMRKRYGWEYGLPAYVLAAFVAVSRVEAKDHYVHDVVAGAAIGMASSYFFTTPYKGWTVRAEADQKYQGIRLCRTW